MLGLCKVFFEIDSYNLLLNVPIRGAQFTADRIALIRSDLKSHDSNRNPKFRSIRCDVFTIFSMCRFFFKSRNSIRAIQFASGSWFESRGVFLSSEIP